MNFAELESMLQKSGFRGFRAKQLYNWLYKKDVRQITEMKNLPGDLIRFLESNYQPGGVELKETREASDGSKKILFSLKDGLSIESVLLPEDNRWTLCISSQVGCSLGCRFCLTGKVGFIRNLTPAEIIDQYQYARREIMKESRITNIVFMGMGEPPLNTDAVIKSIRLLASPEGIAVPSRRITISTAGIVPGIKKLGDADTSVNLAVSLNAPNDEIRSALMPINDKYPLSQLMKSCREFPLDKKRRVTFEYVMLRNINDRPEHARSLVRLVHGTRCKVNLIMFNEDNRIPYRCSSSQAMETFREILRSKDVMVAVRYSKGSDISAACGQLAGDYL